MADMMRYHKTMLNYFTGRGVNFTMDAIRLAFMKSSCVLDTANHEFWSEVCEDEVVGVNYVASGIAIERISVTFDEGDGLNYVLGGHTLEDATALLDPNGFVHIDGDDIICAADPAGFTDARKIVVYQWSGDATTSKLLGCYDLLVDYSNVGHDCRVNFTGFEAGDGIINFE